MFSSAKKMQALHNRMIHFPFACPPVSRNAGIRDVTKAKKLQFSNPSAKLFLICVGLQPSVCVVSSYYIH